MNSVSSIIELENVAFNYDQNTVENEFVVNHWSVQKGEQVFIHGASGSGKSTLLNILSGLLSPKSGKVMVLDKRLDKMNRKQRDAFRAKEIGIVFQRFNLIPYLNSEENIRLANYLSGVSSSDLSAEITKLLERLRIDEKSRTKPVSELSTGQQQRIAIARALINRPRLLIADEPTSSLDYANRDGFLELLKELTGKEEITLLFVSHDHSLKSHFTRSQDISEIMLDGAST